MLPYYAYTLPLRENLQADTVLSPGKPLIFLSTTLWVISFMSHSTVFIELLTISALEKTPSISLT
jgi:hypothetical protein